MKYITEKKKKCVCGRDFEHEHRTREAYVILERGDDVNSDSYMHGYDDEDDHIFELLRELKIEYPNRRYTYRLTKSVNLDDLYLT